MRRFLIAFSAAALIAAVAHPATADHNADDHAGPIELVATWNNDGAYRMGTDLAFWGDMAVLGNFDLPGGFYLLDISDPTDPSLIGQFECPGNQADVAIWEDIVVVSVDQPRTTPECDSASAGAAAYASDAHWEGLRIVSIADPANPVQIATVKTDCGSHTHTLVPDLDNGRLLVYALSYPISGQGVTCNAVSHRKISVVEVPLDAPEDASVIATPSVDPAIGCHDVTVFTETMLAAAACLTESQMWDVSNPAEPEIIAHIPNPPGMNLAHSSAWSYDGETIVIGDELGGALFTPGCLNEGHAPLGALWFYDVSDPAAPVERAWMQLPQQELSLFCTAHNFNVIPVADRNLLVTGWYNGGTNIIDFTDPSNPQQIAYYTPKTETQAGSWSSYWYNGYIYANNFDENVHSTSGLPFESRGLDVFRFDDQIVASAVSFPYLNPQTQEPLPVAATGTGADAGAGTGVGDGTQVLGTQQTTPATGAASWYATGLVLLAAGAALARWTRRTA